MEQLILNLSNNAHANNNVLLEVVEELHKLKNHSYDSVIINGLNDVINKMDYIINENRKSIEIIKKEITKEHNKFDILKFNSMNNQNIQELRCRQGKYIGQVVNGKAEGKGIAYFNNGDIYEGDCIRGNAEGKGIKHWNKGDRYEGIWKNDKKEEKGIYYYSNGDRYEGDWRDGIREGKGIYYYHNGDRYEGEFRNDKKGGKGVYYYSNGDRRMGDYFNDEPIGRHAFLSKQGEIKIVKF